ncbi:MAG TPA: 30S ribosomal protein S20 [Candidatus Bipolaricaulota bacterium]|nr:30S ribosomal protein S20 [Candidatus Bipolaricaulota bacterium]
MPNTNQGKKELRKSIKRSKLNRVAVAKVKTLRKKTLKSIESKSADAEKMIKETIKNIDKQTQKGRIKKNTGSRMKSRLIKNYNKTKAATDSK